MVCQWFLSLAYILVLKNEDFILHYLAEGFQSMKSVRRARVGCPAPRTADVSD